MKNAIILHGKPSQAEYEKPGMPPPSQKHWLGWLQNELSVQGIFTINPDVPEPYKPQYDLWVDAAKNLNIDHQTTLVGHSCGAGFWLRYLTENPQLKPNKLFLVAPYIRREKWPEFFDFKIDPELTQRVIGGIAIFNSLDDDVVIQETVSEIESVLPDATMFEFTDKGHFTYNDLGTEKFPELLAEVLGEK